MKLASLCCLSAWFLFVGSFPLAAAEPPAPATQATAATSAPPQRIDIFEYRVEGVTKLTDAEVEKTVYPWLGEARTPEDVEGARLALEKLYQSKGYQTVVVEVPQQRVADNTVIIQVIEEKVGRLRVHGSRYFDQDRIKEKATSVAEGQVPDFNAFTQEMVSLNQLSDRKVTPAVRAGVVPGTVDVDLNVEDTNPLHGSLELDNRYSPNTTPLRIDGALDYANLWQLDQTVGGSFQIAPERIRDAEVFSGYYIAPIPDTPVKLLLQGMEQNSDVSTLGEFDVVGRGQLIGAQAIVALPGADNYMHNFTGGINYKHFDQLLGENGEPTPTNTPITYWPVSLDYTGTLVEKKSTTQFNGELDFAFREMGSGAQEFDDKRYGAHGDFFYFRGDVSHTHDIVDGLQVFGKVQAQASGQPLISSEQFAGGGLGTVRGYLESEELGDNAIGGTAELRSPSFTLGGVLNEWRTYLFTDWAELTLNNPLPDQQSNFLLGSVGAGMNVKWRKDFNGSLDLGIPLRSEGDTERFDPRLIFRVWAEF